MADVSDDLTTARALQPAVEEAAGDVATGVGTRRRGWSVVWRVWDWARTLAIALVLVLFIRAYFFETFKIPTGSMERTILAGDFLLVNKLAYGAELPFTGRRILALEQPHVGDIVVFRWPKDGQTPFIKRVVGLPGDTIAMRSGVLYRNGLAQVEPYVMHSEPGEDPTYPDFRWQLLYVVPRNRREAAIAEHPSRNNWGPLVVPVHSYFMLGDNRDNSSDSRYWGFVPDSLLGGRPMLVYYSYDMAVGQPFAWLTHVRWDRIGESVN
jgi:signal peptidase I